MHTCECMRVSACLCFVYGHQCVCMLACRSPHYIFTQYPCICTYMHICVYRVLNVRIYIQVMYIGEFVFVKFQVQVQQLTNTYTHIYMLQSMTNNRRVYLCMHVCLYIPMYTCMCINAFIFKHVTLSIIITCL